MVMERFNKKAFTLIELMLVVAIIALLAAIAIPKFANLVVKAKEAAIQGHLGSLRSALTIYYADNEGNYPHPSDLGVLTIGAKYVEKFPRIKIPTTSNHNFFSNPGFIPNSLDPMPHDWDNLDSWVYWTPLVGPRRGTHQILVGCRHTDSKGTIWSTY